MNVTAPSSILKPYPQIAAARRQRVLLWVGIPAVALFCLFYGFAFALLAPFVVLPFSIPILFLAGLAIWALPDLGRAPDRWIEALFFAFFISLVNWPNYLAVGIPGLPWITMLRLTGIPLVCLLLISASISTDFRSRMGKVLNALPLIWKLLVLFVAIQFLSIGLSSNPAGSLQRFVVVQISWTAIFFASAYLFVKPGLVERWSFILWLSAIFVSLIGLWELSLGHVPWAGHIPSFLKIEDEAVTRMLAGGFRSATGAYRISSTFSTPLGLAEYIAFAMPFAIHFVMGDYRWFTKIAAATSIPFMVFVVISTDSRLGIAGCLLACLLYSAYWAALRWKTRKESLFGPAIVIAYPAIFGMAIAATFLVGRLRNSVWGNGAQQDSTNARIEQWNLGIPKIIRNPFGYGIGQGGLTLDYHLPSGLITIDSHYLAMVLEYGPMGFILYFAVFILAIAAACYYGLLSSTRDREYAFLVPIAIALTNFMVIKSVFSQQDNHPLVYMMLGMVVALVHRIKNDSTIAAAVIPPTNAARRAG